MKRLKINYRKGWLLFYCFILLLMACTSYKTQKVITTREEYLGKGRFRVKEVHSDKVSHILKTALSYNGTPYKYGGTTRKGMDCSGLVYTAFTKNGIALERSSYRIATQGEKIQISEIRPGDLVFFITHSAKNRIDHVGLVTDIKNNAIQFIHATTSKGVLISSLDAPYWKRTFVEARNML